MFEQLLPDALVHAAGWTLLHSLWQGAIITLLLAFILGRTRSQAPAFRYHLNVGALFLLLGSVVSTFLYYYEPAIVPDSTQAYTPILFPETAMGTTAIAESDNSGFLTRTFPFLLQLWLVGVAFMGIRMLVELFYLHRLRVANVRPVAASWQQHLQELSSQLGLKTPVALMESTRVSSPLLVGWIKPVILLPVGMLSGLSTEQVACILAHELAHVRRLDYLVNLLQSAVEVVLFFNPAVWWISAQIREEREHCCDELAVGVTGDRLTLVKTLAQLEEWRLQNSQLGLAFNGRPQGILGRVQRLLGGESTVRIIGKGLWSFLLISMLTGVLAIRIQGENPPEVRIWENVGLLMEEDIYDLIPVEIPAVTEEASEEAEPSTYELQKMEELEPLTQTGIHKLRLIQEESLPNLNYLYAIQDTVPPVDKELQAEMEALQKEMQRLQEEMMNSSEMQRMQELTKVYEKEMQAIQEKMMKEHGSYDKLMQEQQKVMRELEAKHQRLWESEPFSTMQEEMIKMTERFQRQAEEVARKYENNPALMEQKLDSLSNIMERRQEAFEKEYGAAMEAIEKEMEAFENSPEMQALEARMEAMDEEMEKLMETKMGSMEEEIEALQEKLEEQFEERMEQLAEQMEKLEYQRLKKLKGREE